jgi:hypothetical protein
VLLATANSFCVFVGAVIVKPKLSDRWQEFRKGDLFVPTYSALIVAMLGVFSWGFLTFVYPGTSNQGAASPTLVVPKLVFEKIVSLKREVNRKTDANDQPVGDKFEHALFQYTVLNTGSSQAAISGAMIVVDEVNVVKFTQSTMAIYESIQVGGQADVSFSAVRVGDAIPVPLTAIMEAETMKVFAINLDCTLPDAVVFLKCRLRLIGDGWKVDSPQFSAEIHSD